MSRCDRRAATGGRRALSLIALLTVAVLACGGDSGGTVTPLVAPPVSVVTTVAIVPAAPVVERGFTTSLAVDVRDQFGAVMNGQPVAWTSSNVAVAAVDAAGVVTGNTIGSTSITATVASK